MAMKKVRILAWICIFNFVFLSFLFYFSPYKIGIYNGQSMNPTFKENELIVLKEFHSSPETKLEKGIIVSYEDSEDKTIHRIVSVIKNQVIAKGDANNTADPPVLIPQIREIYLFTIPNSIFIGDSILVIKKYADGFIALAIILCTVLALLILTRKEGEK